MYTIINSLIDTKLSSMSQSYAPHQRFNAIMMETLFKKEKKMKQYNIYKYIVYMIVIMGLSFHAR